MSKQVRFECRDAASNRLLFCSPDWYSVRRSVDLDQERGRIAGGVVIVDRELLIDGRDDGIVWRSGEVKAA
jgi:hypothetical protein